MDIFLGFAALFTESGPDEAWKFIESVACAAQDFCCAFTTGRHLDSTVLSHERGGGTGCGKGLARVRPGCARRAPPAGPFLGFMEHTASLRASGALHSLFPLPGTHLTPALQLAPWLRSQTGSLSCLSAPLRGAGRSPSCPVTPH